MNISPPLTDDEITSAAHTLSKLKPGFLPLDIFNQIARLTVLTAIELVPVRWHNGNIEILLTAREADDPHWPGMLHTAGTALRATDSGEQYASAFQRLFSDELPGVTVNGDPIFVATFLHQNTRGATNVLAYYVEVTDNAGVGAFYAVDALPSNLVASQLDFIPAATQAFARATPQK